MSNDVSLDINQESNPVQTVAPPKEDNNMLRATDKITALYCRLSVEDTKEKGGKDDPSNSIQHQQIMLMEYAKSQHFPNPTYFIDDGYSGVEFNNRPGFQRMLAEIEAGHVEVVITKDLSRLGRNSSLTGLYINYTFPQYGVRYIAINDHFDTIDPNSTDNDVAGIKNWFNEFFAKDTSRKIRAVQKAKGEQGIPLTTNVPFGYRKDPEDRTKWIVDEAAALVVKRIFKLCMEGRGPMQIAKLLQARTELFTEIPEMVDFIDALPEYDIALYTHKKMKTNPENSLESLKEVLPVLEGVEDWTEENIHDALFDLIGKLGVKNGIVLWPLRVAVSGKAFTPGGGVEISYLIGKEDTLARIRKGIEKLS